MSETEFCKSLYPLGFLLRAYFFLLLPDGRACSNPAVNLHLTAVVKSNPTEGRTATNFLEGRLNPGNLILRHHLWDSFREETQTQWLFVMGQAVVDRMFDFPINCFANWTHSLCDSCTPISGLKSFSSLSSPTEWNPSPWIPWHETRDFSGTGSSLAV